MKNKMKIDRIKIKNFKSIVDLSFECGWLSVLCGPNSVGKSNIFRAIELAFSNEIDERNFVKNISFSKKDSNAQIQVDVIFSGASKQVRELAGVLEGDIVKYAFRATKKGVITRRLNENVLDESSFEAFLKEFSIVYVPTIRDLDGEGMVPFQRLFRKSVHVGSVGKEIQGHISSIKSQLANKASAVLANQRDVVRNILGAKSFDINTDSVVIDQSYDSIRLAVKTFSNQKIPLGDLGTGHQSVAIISFYRQLGAETPGHTLYLFEEPDTHLHPPTVRAVGEELIKISQQSQVLVTTHSPILIAHVGLDKAFHLTHSDQAGTTIAKSGFSPADQTNVSHLLMLFGLRLTEALFTKTVLLVEGASDVAVIGRLLERRLRRNLDQLDLLLVPAGGKGTMPELAEALTKLKIKWIAILDQDALYAECTPITSVEGYEEAKRENFVRELQKITACIDLTKKRGQKVKKHIDLLRSELENGRPKNEPFEKSVLEDLLIKGRNVGSSGLDRIKTAIQKNQKEVLKKILKSYNIFIMRPDIEHVLASKDNNIDVIESVLRKFDFIKKGTKSPCCKDFIIKRLHEVGRKSQVLTELVDRLDESSGFARTDLNAVVNEVVGLINQ